MKRVASAPVANSYRNQVKAGILDAMRPRTDSDNLAAAKGVASAWRVKLLSSRPTLEKKLDKTSFTDS